MESFVMRPGDTREVHVQGKLASGNDVQIIFGGHSPSQGVAGEKVAIYDELGKLFGGITAVAVGGTDIVRITAINNPQMPIAWQKNYSYTLGVDYTDASGTKVHGTPATFNVDPSALVSIG